MSLGSPELPPIQINSSRSYGACPRSTDAFALRYRLRYCSRLVRIGDAIHHVTRSSFRLVDARRFSVVAFLAFPRTVTADPSPATPEPTSQAPGTLYQVPDECPSHQEFLREVYGRGSFDVQERLRELAVRVSVSIRRTDKFMQGTVWLESGEQRQVHGETCREVVQALALVVALQARLTEDSPLGPKQTSPTGDERCTGPVCPHQGAPQVGLPPARDRNGITTT